MLRAPAHPRGISAYRLVGPLAGLSDARMLADATVQLLDRYVREVVLGHALCPFLTHPDAGLGAVYVVVDHQLDEVLLEELVAGAESAVLHVVYPLARGPAPTFERFVGRVGGRLRARLGRAAPVSASFHPAMHGQTDDPHRLIGLFRRAPHAFAQYVPADIPKTGGTTVASAPGANAKVSGAEANFARLVGSGELSALLATLDELHGERDRTTAAWVSSLEASRPTETTPPA